MRAYITLYLTLSLGIILTLLITLIEGTRLWTIRYETECVMDMAMNSTMAEYNKELLRQYNLFYIDSSYGTSNASYSNTEKQFAKYMSMNFEPNIPGKNIFFKDITEINPDNATLMKASVASDGGGKVLRYQITESMKDSMGIGLAESILQNANIIQGEELKGQGLADQRFDVSMQIDGLIEEENKEVDDEDEYKGIENPADEVNEGRGCGILGLAMSPDQSISLRHINETNYLSHRTVKSGSGLDDNKNDPDDLIGRGLYYGYLFDKCGYYGKVKEEGALQYQIEYMISGGGSDEENLRKIYERILLIREAVNVGYLFSDSIKMAEADALAATITAAFTLPQLQPLVKVSIILAWGYAESVQDIRILMDGHRVPIIKSTDTWNTPLIELLTFYATLDIYKEPSSGMNYSDYLVAFLLVQDIDKTTYRLMDIMEMDIRKTAGNEYFRMDGCFDSIMINANISSGYGYSASINRTQSYD